MSKTVLTELEKRFLRYPPTEKTWLCDHTVTTEFEQVRDGKTVKRTRTTVEFVANSGRSHECISCGKAKPRRPKLAWPIYQAALRRQEGR